MVWINQIPNPSIQLVLSIKKTQKGLILITSQYDVFLYHSSQNGIHLNEALAYWTDENDGWGIELWIHPNPKTKLGFDIKPGKELEYFINANCWTIEENESVENPFILKTLKQNSNKPSNPIIAAAEKAKAKKLARKINPDEHQPPLEAQ